jgi:hypothetical protein
MAQAVTHAMVPGKTVLLIAGARHVEPAVGVPQHLSPGVRIRSERLPEAPARKDYCAELREQFKRSDRTPSPSSDHDKPAKP